MGIKILVVTTVFLQFQGAQQQRAAFNYLWDEVTLLDQKVADNAQKLAALSKTIGGMSQEYDGKFVKEHDSLVNSIQHEAIPLEDWLEDTASKLPQIPTDVDPNGSPDYVALVNDILNYTNIMSQSLQPDIAKMDTLIRVTWKKNFRVIKTAFANLNSGSSLSFGMLDR